jgi:esterase/lipase superfamily enzyme
MVDAVRGLIDEGRIKLYCVDSHDGASWSAKNRPLEERARQHGVYETWITENVVPAIYADCGGRTDIVTTGASAGAFHAVNFALKRADLFPLAIGLSGNYDPTTWGGWGEQGEQTYFNNPMAYVANLDGDHLEWLRSRVSLVLVVGQGAWEVDPTKALPSTRQFSALLRAKGIPPRARRLGLRRPRTTAVVAAAVRAPLVRFTLRARPFSVDPDLVGWWRRKVV